MILNHDEEESYRSVTLAITVKFCFVRISMLWVVFFQYCICKMRPRSERSLWTWISCSHELSGWWLGWIIFEQPSNIQPIHHKERKIPSIPNTKHTKHTVVYTMVSCSTYKSIIEHKKWLEITVIVFSVIFFKEKFILSTRRMWNRSFWFSFKDFHGMIRSTHPLGTSDLCNSFMHWIQLKILMVKTF